MITGLAPLLPPMNWMTGAICTVVAIMVAGVFVLLLKGDGAPDKVKKQPTKAHKR